MTVTGMTKAQLEIAANEVGVTLDMTTLNTKGTRHRVKVNLGPNRDLYRKIRTSFTGNDRRVNAVCWHGFRDFFRACFKREPEARFQTALDTWNGSVDFETRYRQSGNTNIGSMIYPQYASEACDCYEGSN